MAAAIPSALRGFESCDLLDLSAILVNKVSYGAAFLAGLASFLSPCVLPLIPAWLTLATGLNYDELISREDRRRGDVLKMFGPTLFFVLGFSLVFCLLGATAGLVGEFLRNYAQVLRYLAGVFLIFFGLYLTGAIAPAFLMREKRVHLRGRPLGLAGAFVVGLGFAAGWTPCVGPVLTSILALAALEQSAGQAVRLLAVYSLGLGLPFLVLSLAWGTVWSFLSRLRPVLNWSGRVLGGLLLIVGLLVLSGRLNLSI